jgi:Ca2+-binding EF-hand superfamily protein
MATSFETILSTIFQTIDGNDDGHLTKSEIFKAATKHRTTLEALLNTAPDDLCNQLGCLLKPNSIKTFFLFPTKEKGKITYSEFSNYVCRRILDSILQELFRVMDRNGDAKLTKTELGKTLLMHATKIQEFVPRITATGIATQTDLLFKPKHCMELFANAATNEPGLVTLQEFQDILSNSPGNDTAQDETTASNDATTVATPLLPSGVPAGPPLKTPTQPSKPPPKPDVLPPDDDLAPPPPAPQQPDKIEDVL